MKAFNAIAAAMLIAIPGVAMAASEPPPGASSCSGCHAPNVGTAMPKIYGRKAADIVTAMVAFRDGSTPSTVMGRIAKGFTDDQIKTIAAWLAEQK